MTEVSEEIRQGLDIIYHSISEDTIGAQKQNLLEGKQGLGAQVLLIQLSIAINRIDRVNRLTATLKQNTQTLRFNNFFMADDFGNYKFSLSVLKDKLFGQNGLITQKNTELEIIKTNLVHISSESKEEQAIYWRPRIKSFKFSLMQDLDYYSTAAKIALEKAVVGLYDASTQAIHLSAEAKNITEREQEVWIKSKTTNNLLSIQDSHTSDVKLLRILLKDLKSKTQEDFDQKVLKTIEATLPLSLFVQLYEKLNLRYESHLQHIQNRQTNFIEELDKKVRDCKKSLDDAIDVMDYNNLPQDLGLQVLFAPVAKVTEEALTNLENYHKTWRQTVYKALDELQGSVHG